MNTAEAKIYNAFSHYVPQAAVNYCFELWSKYPFTFKIKKGRVSKLGDYRFNPKTKQHTITVNRDLNPYSFLITYIHEVAHLVTFSSYKRSVKPHGEEWKSAFRQLAFPILTTQVFPEEVIKPLAKYLKNPKATSCSDHHLLAALYEFDDNPKTLLGDLKHGEVFKLGNKTFKKEQLRRTRYLCTEISSGKKYLVSKSAPVKTI